jgi:hypothetical protein
MRSQADMSALLNCVVRLSTAGSRRGACQVKADVKGDRMTPNMSDDSAAKGADARGAAAEDECD